MPRRRFRRDRGEIGQRPVGADVVFPRRIAGGVFVITWRTHQHHPSAAALLQPLQQFVELAPEPLPADRAPPFIVRTVFAITVEPPVHIVGADHHENPIRLMRQHIRLQAGNQVEQRIAAHPAVDQPHAALRVTRLVIIVQKFDIGAVLRDAVSGETDGFAVPESRDQLPRPRLLHPLRQRRQKLRILLLLRLRELHRFAPRPFQPDASAVAPDLPVSGRNPPIPHHRTPELRCRLLRPGLKHGHEPLLRPAVTLGAHVPLRLQRLEMALAVLPDHRLRIEKIGDGKFQRFRLQPIRPKRRPFPHNRQRTPPGVDLRLAAQMEQPGITVPFPVRRFQVVENDRRRTLSLLEQQDSPVEAVQRGIEVGRRCVAAHPDVILSLPEAGDPSPAVAAVSRLPPAVDQDRIVGGGTDRVAEMVPVMPADVVTGVQHQLLAARHQVEGVLVGVGVSVSPIRGAAEFQSDVAPGVGDVGMGDRDADIAERAGRRQRPGRLRRFKRPPRQRQQPQHQAARKPLQIRPFQIQVTVRIRRRRRIRIQGAVKSGQQRRGDAQFSGGVRAVVSKPRAFHIAGAGVDRKPDVIPQPRIACEVQTAEVPPQRARNQRSERIGLHAVMGPLRRAAVTAAEPRVQRDIKRQHLLQELPCIRLLFPDRHRAADRLMQCALPCMRIVQEPGKRSRVTGRLQPFDDIRPDRRTLLRIQFITQIIIGERQRLRDQSVREILVERHLLSPAPFQQRQRPAFALRPEIRPVQHPSQHQIFMDRAAEVQHRHQVVDPLDLLIALFRGRERTPDSGLQLRDQPVGISFHRAGDVRSDPCQFFGGVHQPGPRL